MKSFRQFNEEAVKEAVFTFGRFNPPTVGHEKLIQKVASVSKGNNYFIYASHSQDKDKNPLDYKEKIQLMRKMFPKYGRNIIESNAKNVFDIAVDLYDKGYNKLTMVVGSDRINEFTILLKKYDNIKARHGFYSFPQGIFVVSAGERDPDADDVSGMSASKMRAAAADGDWKSFQKGLPKGFGEGPTLFNRIRTIQGYEPITDFREHVQLTPISSMREKYIAGDIFNIGDIAIAENNKEVIIIARKPNYVIVESGKKYWIHDLIESSKKTRYKEIYDAISDKMVAKYGDRAEDIKIKLATKLADKKFDEMSIHEMSKRIREYLFKYK